jgi:ABC-2 type transport system ATP-binding protein
MKELDTPTRTPVQQVADPPGDPVIVARGLRREFGREVGLAQLDLAVPRGLIFGFIGPSGAGKTTAVRLLTGIDKPTAGRALVLGRSTDEFDGEMRSRIGYMPQLSVQFPNLSVHANMGFVASLYGVPLRGRRRIVAEALERTELDAHRRKAVRKLSGGMRRRLALSAALVHGPEVLFLDEPTAGIDPVLRRKLWDHFEVLRGQGRTLFVTTQYVSEAAYCDRVGVLADGRLVAEGPPDELRRLAMGGDVLELEPSAPFDEAALAGLREVPGVRDLRTVGGWTVCIVVDKAAQRLPDIQQWCSANGIDVQSLQEVRPPFDDVFAALMERYAAAPEPEAADR